MAGDGATMRGAMNGARLFSCSAGVRVVTGLDGTVRGLVGIDRAARHVLLTVPPPGDAAALGGNPPALTLRAIVKPNEEWSVDVAAGSLKLSRAAPFTLPFD